MQREPVPFTTRTPTEKLMTQRQPRRRRLTGGVATIAARAEEDRRETYAMQMARRVEVPHRARPRRMTGGVAAMAARAEAIQLEEEEEQAELMRAERDEVERIEAKRMEADRMEADRVRAEGLDAGGRVKRPSQPAGDRKVDSQSEGKREKIQKKEAVRKEAMRIEILRRETEEMEAERKQWEKRVAKENRVDARQSRNLSSPWRDMRAPQMSAKPPATPYPPPGLASSIWSGASMRFDPRLKNQHMTNEKYHGIMEWIQFPMPTPINGAPVPPRVTAILKRTDDAFNDHSQFQREGVPSDQKPAVQKPHLQILRRPLPPSILDSTFPNGHREGLQVPLTPSIQTPTLNDG